MRRRPTRPAARRATAVLAVCTWLTVAGCGGGEQPVDEQVLPEIVVGSCLADDQATIVPCSDPHAAQTVLVSTAEPARGPAALVPCRSAQTDFLGQDFNTRLDVRLWVATDRSSFRCDVVLRNSTRSGSGYADLVGSLEGIFSRGVPVSLRACLGSVYDPQLDQEYVPCRQPHRSRELVVAPSIGTVDEPFPDDVEQRAVDACNATAAGDRHLEGALTVAAHYPQSAEVWSRRALGRLLVSAHRGRLPAVKRDR